MASDDVLSQSRPLSPSDFLYPVDDPKDLESDPNASANRSLDQSFGQDQLFGDNAGSFDPFTDPFQDLSPPYQLENGPVNLKRPFETEFLRLENRSDADDSEGGDKGSDDDDFYDVSSSLGPPVKRRSVLLPEEDASGLYDGLDEADTSRADDSVAKEGTDAGEMELEDQSSEEEEADNGEGSTKKPTERKEREQIPKDLEYSVDFEEIDNLLDQGLEKGVKSYRRKADGKIVDVRTRYTLVHLGKDPFEVLPDGWIELTHESGMPIYLHRRTRVCCLSKPYSIGRGSTRKHELPISAVPCFQYRQALKQREEMKERANGATDVLTIQEPGKTDVVPVIRNPPEAGVADKTSPKEKLSTSGAAETAEAEVAAPESASPEPMETTPIPDSVPFLSSPSASPLPPLPSENSLLPQPPPSLSSSLPDASTPIMNGPLGGCPFSGSSAPEAENSQGEATVSTKDASSAPGDTSKTDESRRKQTVKATEMHDYCKNLFEFDHYTVKRFRSWKDRREHQRVMKKIRPQIQSKLITYKLPGDPTALGKAKLGRQFQLNPVGKSPICVLHEYVQHVLKISPEYVYSELENPQEPYSCTVILNEVEYGRGTGSSKKQAKLEAAKATMKVLIPQLYAKGGETFDDQDALNGTISFFNDIQVEDPRVTEFSQKSGQPAPYQILIECLKRNYGMGNTDVSMSMELCKNPKRFSKFTMTVGKHTKTVKCKNKKFGKQASAQGILQLLHPHVNSWGSLLRLYGYDSRQRNERRKREEEQAVTELQSRARPNRPNTAILDKLRLEMNKLNALRTAFERGRTTFTPADKNDLPYNKTALPTLDL